MACEQATELAEYYKIERQRPGESDLDFRQRVSGVLRQCGHLIEAHEAYQNARYDSEGPAADRVATGIFGGAARILQHREYAGDSIGHDLAAGEIVRDDTPQMSPDMALLLVAMMGGR